MMKMSRPLVAGLLLPLFAQADNFQIPVMGGFTMSALENARSVTVNETPEVINDYIADQDTVFGYMAGMGLVYSFDKVSPAPFTYNFGLMGYFVEMGNVEGTEYPFINAGSFDTLDYHFKAKSVAFMLQPRIIYTKYPFQPYVFLGIGMAKNHLYDYKEKPSDPSGSAVAAPNPYASKTVTSYAYEVGAGIQHKISHDTKNNFKYLLSLDYRYMNLGDAELGVMPGQLTRDAPKVNNLNTQALVFSITTQF